MESSYGIMTKREEYLISFQRKLTSNGQYNFATTKEVSNGDIANHISNSDRTITEIQINDLQKAIIGEPSEEHWGEVMGSQLEIYPQTGKVQVGYTNRQIPIVDFKQLLEEWLEFISS